MNPNFLPTLKPLFTPTTTQIDSLNALFTSMDKHGVIMPEQRAYIFATAYHESRLKPVEENGEGKGHKYGTKVDINGKPYTTPDKLFYGRSFVQLTWIDNYRAFSGLLKIDMVNHPELALDTHVAAEIIVQGMKLGMFTGRTLNTYFNAKIIDPIQARRIINGVKKGEVLPDCAELIKGYYDLFLKALKS